ncbi:hypothetical protein CCR75_009006 [Bremia lactucae]|uniref:FYVE-type domain-containing protein n=1 Tax=Bremia lactucae TaxID=4779 RepID=A0A976NXC3_BRELC|nr:hypothetical protein CCR75_009006 [Bremia lactucae]
MVPCPSCSADVSHSCSCSQCGTKLVRTSSIQSTYAVKNSSLTRRNTSKDRIKKKKQKDKERVTTIASDQAKDKIITPPAASGDEAAMIYKKMLAAVRGANQDHDEVVRAFKADCKLYGQGQLRSRVFYERLSTYFGSELMLAHMLPELVRLIAHDQKRRKLMKVHAKSKQTGGFTSPTTSNVRASNNPPPLLHTDISTRSRMPRPVQIAGTRPLSASALIRQDSIESDTSSTTSGEFASLTRSGPTSRVVATRHAHKLQCAICSEGFDLKRRRHHCRKCGASVCPLCSPARMLISPDHVVTLSTKEKKHDPSHPQRVCTICAPLLQCFQNNWNAQYANCHKANPHEAKSRVHLPYSRSLESACRSAADILGNFFRPEHGAESDRYIPVRFLKRAQGIAFLTVIKAGLLITAKMGTGIVIVKLENGTWSAPSAIGTAGIGGGLEGGGELIEFMVIMGSKKAVKVFYRTQVNIGGGLSVAIGPFGRDALAQAAASREGFNANYSYSHSRGLFAGISLQGALLSARTEMNSNFYGQKVTPQEILTGAIPPPRAAQCLYDAIEQAKKGIARFEASETQRRRSASSHSQGMCSSCRCQEFVAKAFSKKCKTCAHVHRVT